MPLLLNKTAAMISASTYPVWGKPDATGRQVIEKAGKLFNFPPGQLVEIGEKDLEALKEVPLIQRSLDNDDIVMGRKAKKVAEEDKKEAKDREEKVKEK